MHSKARATSARPDVVRAFGLEDDYVLIGPRGESLIEMPWSRLLEPVRHSAMLLNIMGYLRDEEILGRASKRIFLDIDPGFGQFWDDLRLYRPFAGYNAYLTISLKIGLPDCNYPELRPFPTGSLTPRQSSSNARLPQL